jgi:hypothetical protein
MKREILYPRRQRCHACRRFFGPLVVKGLYCSYGCAGMPPPLPGEAGPGGIRQCANNGYGKPKKRWDIEEEARDYARVARACGDDLESYACGRCGGWHVGHAPGSRKKRRRHEDHQDGETTV